MSQILVDIQTKKIVVDDYISLHSVTDFVIQNAKTRNFVLTISTHQGIILFRIGNFVDDGINLTARTNLVSDGLVDAFRHVPHSGCRRFLLNIHDRNASFSIQFSDELVIWNDIAHTTDMSEYALKTEIPDVSNFITIKALDPYAKTADLPNFNEYVLKSDLPNLENYALKSELFSGNYNDLNGKPDFSTYALKSEIPNVSNFITVESLAPYAKTEDLPDFETFALKNELFSGNYNDLNGKPDLSQYALASAIPKADGSTIYNNNGIWSVIGSAGAATSVIVSAPLIGAGTIENPLEIQVGNGLRIENGVLVIDDDSVALKNELFSGDYLDLNNKPDFSIYALKSDLPNLENYALKSELFSGNYNDLNGKPDLSVYMLKTEFPDMSQYALKTEIPEVSNFITIESLTPYAKTEDLPDFETFALKSELFSGNYNDLNGKPNLSIYALKTEIPEVSNFITVESLTPYAKTEDLPDFETFALKNELFSGNYNDLNEKPNLSIYALKTEIPEVSNFITIESLTPYAKTEDLPDFETFALKSELTSGTTISRFTITRPTGSEAYHLKIQYSEIASFSEVQTLVDTLNTAADREKVLVFQESIVNDAVSHEFLQFPSEGLGPEFEGNPVVVDFSPISDGKTYFVRYTWYTEEVSGEWTGAIFPSCGAGGGGASGTGTPGEDGVGIEKIEKTGTVGLVDTYRITFSDSSYFTFTVTNGKNGESADLATVKQWVENAILNGEW